MANPYEVLGVDPKASTDEIKKVYRRKARESHPDAGGDKEEFTKLAIAWGIISDPKKREEYDRTGQVRDESAAMREAIENVSKMLTTYMEQGSQVKVIQMMRDAMRRAGERIAGQVRIAREQRTQTLAVMEETKKRMRKKRGASDQGIMEHIWAGILESAEQPLKAALEEQEKHARVCECMEQIIGSWEDVETRAVQTVGWHFSSKVTTV